MAEFPSQQSDPREVGRRRYVGLQEKYAPYTNGNEFLTIPEALDAVVTRTISLLTTDMVTRRLIE